MIWYCVFCVCRFYSGSFFWECCVVCGIVGGRGGGGDGVEF